MKGNTNMTKKAISLILAVLMLLPLSVACAETPSEGATTSADPSLTTAAPLGSDVPEETELMSKTLPADLKFNGETVTILSRDASFVSDELWVDDQNGSMVNDEIYKRNAKVMEQLDVTIESFRAMLILFRQRYAMPQAMARRILTLPRTVLIRQLCTRARTFSLTLPNVNILI